MNSICGKLTDVIYTRATAGDKNFRLKCEPRAEERRSCRTKPEISKISSRTNSGLLLIEPHKATRRFRFACLTRTQLAASLWSRGGSRREEIGRLWKLVFVLPMYCNPINWFARPSAAAAAAAAFPSETIILPSRDRPLEHSSADLALDYADRPSPLLLRRKKKSVAEYRIVSKLNRKPPLLERINLRF